MFSVRTVSSNVHSPYCTFLLPQRTGQWPPYDYGICFLRGCRQPPGKASSCCIAKQNFHADAVLATPAQQESLQNFMHLTDCASELWIDATVGGGATSSGRIETLSCYRHYRPVYRICASHQQVELIVSNEQ